MIEKYEPAITPEDIDPNVPESLLEFERIYDEKHPSVYGGCHNVYHIVAEDLDGNVVSESFAVNSMTDKGFLNKHQCDSSYEASTGEMFFGDGEFDDIDPTSSTMVHAISNKSASISSADCSHVHTRWMPEKQCNMVRFRLAIGVLDYSFWPEDHVITEIGLTSRYYTGINNLKYHAAIYDADGNKSSFVKKLNQKLTITVYARSIVPIAKLVNQSWDKDIPCVIQSRSLIQNYYQNYWCNVTTNYNPYNFLNSWYNYWGFRSYDQMNKICSIQDNVFTVDTNMNFNIFMDGRYQYLSEVCLNSVQVGVGNQFQWNSHFLFVSKIRTPEPIPFQLDHYRTFAYHSPHLINTYCFRLRDDNDTYGQLPMTNIHINSLTMYNGQTDEWDIDVPFSEPVPYMEAGNTHLRYSVSEHNWISFQERYAEHRVFINEAPENPIKRILNLDKAVYVTDTYWDSSTWELISNVNDISREHGSKRFFITFESEFDYWGVDDVEVGYYCDRGRSRKVERHDNNQFPRLNLNNGYGEDHVNFGIRYVGYYSYLFETAYPDTAGKSICNERLGYIACDGFLLFPDTVNPNPLPNYYNPSVSANIQGIPYLYNIGGIDLPDDTSTGSGHDGTYRGLIWNTTRGNRIINFGVNSYSKGCRVYNMTDDPTKLPSYENFTFDQPWSTHPGYSHSDNGYLVTSWVEGGNNKNCTYVIAYGVEGQEPTMYKVEGYHHAFAIDLTNYFVAIDATVTDHLHMVIYDMANREVYDEFDIPEGQSFQGIAGWKNFIYVRTGDTGKSTYLYYINERILERTSFDCPQMRWDSSSWYSHIQLSVPTNGNIESCMVLIASDRDISNENHVVFKESDPTHPIQLIRNENHQTSNYVRRRKAWMGYVNDGKQLILTYECYRLITIDVSWVLKHGTLKIRKTNGDLYSTRGDQSPIYYKGYIYYLSLYKEEGGYTLIPGVNAYGYYTSCRFWRSPYQQHIDLQITGSTYTPNSMMNPIRVQGNICHALFMETNRDVDAFSES